MKRALLDTSAFSRLLAGDPAVLDALGQAETVYLSVVVLGELLAGFKAGTRERKNTRLLHTFLLKPTVKMLNATADTAEFFASVKAGLRKSGKPIPMNDVWIAAQALECGATLVTYDRHFEAVEGLMLWGFPQG